jgi:hypothetical protein
MDLKGTKYNIKGKTRSHLYSLWLFIHEGKSHPIGLATLNEYQDLFHPVLETGFQTPISMLWKITNQSHEKSAELLMKYYQNLVNSKLYFPGQHGDWIKCSVLAINEEKYLNLDILGQAAWGSQSFDRKIKGKKEFGHLKKAISRALWIYFKNNKAHPIGLAPLRDYSDFLHPIIETKFQTPISMTWNVSDQPKAKTEEQLTQYYQELVGAKLYTPGRYGDWMKCTQIMLGSENEKYINLDILGAAAWIKPTLAADLGIFIKTQDKYYFVCIVRGNDPGKGKPAIIGGIMNTGAALDSAAFTMLKEIKEEGNLTIEYSGDLEKLRENYGITDIPVIVRGFEKLNSQLAEIKTSMYYSSTVATSEQDRNLDGTKRVYNTTAFVILVDVGNISISLRDLDAVFRAGDDAVAMRFYDVSPCFTPNSNWNIPKFGLNHHHEIFINMVNKLKHQYSL